MAKPIGNPIIVALDNMDREEAIDVINELGKKVWGYKLSVLVLKYGVNLFEKIQEKAGSVNLFIDLEFTGTPRFIKESIEIFSKPDVSFISINAASGPRGVRTAVETAKISRILVGSLLSSLDIADVKFIFETPYREIKTSEFTRMAKECRAYGIFCSTEELEFLSHHPYTKDIPRIAIGVRTEWYSSPDDHTYVLSPKATIERGAEKFVIGRPITKAKNRIEAVEKILKELES